MLEWSQRWCEEVQRESVRCGRNVLIKPTWKYVGTPLVSTATVEAVETLSWYATVVGIRTEQECEMFRRRHEYEKSSMQTVISTTTSHRAKRDEAQLRVVTHECADAMRVPEHYASTLCTRTLQSVTSRLMSKCRTRQLESCEYVICVLPCLARERRANEVSERSRLSDGWRWQLARAFFPLSPGVSTQWLPGGVHSGDRREVR